MPFKLYNALISFQTFINRILREFLGRFVIIYLDNIVVYLNSTENYLRHFTQVFEVIRKHILYIKPSKCIFAVLCLEFCGYLIKNKIIRFLSSKVVIIKEWLTFINVHEVRVFLGMITYYRRFIRAFAKIYVSLFDLLKEADAEIRKKKFRKIKWTVFTKTVFRTLKERFTEALILL
jgi:hypothetical protein